LHGFSGLLLSSTRLGQRYYNVHVAIFKLDEFLIIANVDLKHTFWGTVKRGDSPNRQKARLPAQLRPGRANCLRNYTLPADGVIGRCNQVRSKEQVW
jgi:hypothetical protein